MEVVREREETTNGVLAYANSCRHTKWFTDVCVKAGNKSFQAHRLILSFYSRRFKTTFSRNVDDSNNTFLVVEVDDERVDDTSLESLIDFIYSGKIHINQQNVLGLLATSNYLQIDDAKQYCFEYLESNISVETCGEVLKIADLYQNESLLSKSLKYICSNIRKIPPPDEFKLISKRHFFEFVAKLNEEHIEQRFIYDVIIGWVKHNAKRKEVFAELFQRLDLRRLTSSFLADTASNEILVRDNRVCWNLIIEAMKLRQHVSNNAGAVLTLGGQDTRKEVFTVYRDDKNVYPALPQAADRHCSLELDDFVYCIGGYKLFSSTARVWRMRISDSNIEWEEVASMMVGRSEFGAAVYRNGIAVAGGCTRRARKSAEFYNPSFNQWKALAPINNYRKLNALVSCNDCLFCLGGYGEGKCLSSVEKLCNVDGVWQHVQSMQTPRREFASVNCLGDIYAIGGQSDQLGSTKSVEKYDFKSNSWNYVNEINVERRGHSACVMQDKIYIVGGKNAANEFVSEIECYDPSNGQWSIVGGTEKKLFRHSIVAI